MNLHIGSAFAILALLAFLVTFLALIFTGDHGGGKLYDPRRVDTTSENDPDVVFAVTREYEKWQEYEAEKERRMIAELDAQAEREEMDRGNF